MAPLSTSGGEAGLGNMLWMSFGYAVQVSPLHTLTLYNAVANNGRMMKPYLVSSVQRDGVLIKKFEPTVLEENICKPAVIQSAREAMEMVVTEGTAKKALKGLPFSAAGKTGTAHVSDGAIKYANGVYQATFVGYFPADKPQFTCIVVIRTKPHAASHYGGTLAAPVFKEIATKLYAMYVEQKTPSSYVLQKDSSMYFYAGAAADIRRVLNTLRVQYQDSVAREEWSTVYARNQQPVVKAVAIRNMVMPNVRGMGLKDALYLLENMGLRVAVKGKGKVAVQSVSPGTQLAKGITVVLELS
jgi:cell division protein FtsI (penicillin-binding protein 3)